VKTITAILCTLVVGCQLAPKPARYSPIRPTINHPDYAHASASIPYPPKTSRWLNRHPGLELSATYTIGKNCEVEPRTISGNHDAPESVLVDLVSVEEEIYSAEAYKEAFGRLHAQNRPITNREFSRAYKYLDSIGPWPFTRAVLAEDGILECQFDRDGELVSASLGTQPVSMDDVIDRVFKYFVVQAD